MSSPRPGRRALVVVAAVVLLQAVLVLAFVVPGHDPAPHDVPVGVVGPPAAAAAVEARAPAGALRATAFPDAAAARAAILERDVYGAFVPGPAGRPREVLVATAASPAVAQLLRGAAGPEARVTDLRPLDADDPRGATLNLLFLPLIVVCLPTALLLGRLRLPARTLVAVIALFAALGGLAVVGLVAGALGALPGPFLALAGIAALTILAITLSAAALERLLGPAGVGLAALVVFVVGNPASGNASAPELLPSPWRELGPLLPPGAAGDALRGTAYFDGAAVGAPLAVLAAWAVLGAALVLAARRRAHAPAAAPAAQASLHPAAA
jgi:hypothetical protein